MARFSEAGRRAMRRLNNDTLDTSLVLRRNGADLPAQLVRIRRVSQSEFDESEAVSWGDARLEVSGALTLDIQAEDRFTWDGSNWAVMETPVIGANSLARRAIAGKRA